MSSMPSPRRIVMWALVGLFVVSLGRWIAYALAAGTLAQKLSTQCWRQPAAWSHDWC
jgi:hypothetical protein